MALLVDSTPREARSAPPLKLGSIWIMPNIWRPTTRQDFRRCQIPGAVLLGVVAVVVLIAALITQEWWGLFVIPILAVAAAVPRTR